MSDHHHHVITRDCHSCCVERECSAFYQQSVPPCARPSGVLELQEAQALLDAAMRKLSQYPHTTQIVRRIDRYLDRLFKSERRPKAAR
jgi:hypothetical protein